MMDDHPRVVMGLKMFHHVRAEGMNVQRRFSRLYMVKLRNSHAIVFGDTFEDFMNRFLTKFTVMCRLQLAQNTHGKAADRIGFGGRIEMSEGDVHHRIDYGLGGAAGRNLTNETSGRSPC